MRVKEKCIKYVKLFEKSCNAFIGLSIRAKMIGGGRPHSREKLANTDSPPCKTPIFNLLSLVVPQRNT